MNKEEKILKLEELKKQASELKKQVDYYNALQLALKLVLNGSYGAFAASYFILFNNHVAGTITAQGRDLTKTMDRVNEDYWYNQWHLDTELHEKMNLKNVTPLKQSEKVSIYADTDSCQFDSLIKTENDEVTIEEFYNRNMINGSNGVTLKGHESVSTTDKILNYSNEKGLYYANVKRIIRHKVSKPKWKLRTKSGKEIIVTNDHSMIVFRDNQQIEVKPSEILKTDKILTIK
jgi:DNA polymerase elongation subunit (family B)